MDSATWQLLVTGLARVLPYETRQDPWEFDWKSAGIGAGAMLVLCVLLYTQRELIKELLQKLWSPVTEWRKQSQASQEEKYITALLNTIKGKLSYLTKNSPADFQPPQFQIPTPLPLTLADAAKPVDPVYVHFNAILGGHNKLIITGDYTSGRTRAMYTMVQMINQAFTKSGELKRLPIWLDLMNFTLPDGEDEKAQLPEVGTLAQGTVPSVNPRWIAQSIAKRPTVVLLDNWESLTTEKRIAVAEWISTIEEGEDTIWVVSSDQAGYGTLTEQGFVPVSLEPDTSARAIDNLYANWVKELSIQRELSEDIVDAFNWISDAGAGLEELTSRIVLYLKTEELPETPGAVAEALLLTHLPIDTSNPETAEAWNLAQQATLAILIKMAGESTLKGQVYGRQDMAEMIETHMPAKEERPSKLDSMIRKMLQGCSFLRRQGKQWLLEQGYWNDYLLARYLLEQDFGIEFIEAHLDDPAWTRIVEFYASYVDLSELLEPALEFTNTTGSIATLRKLVRIALISQRDFALKNGIIKTIAALFMDPGLSSEARLGLGRSLTQIAGQGSRAFFVKMLRSPALPVRCAALRGIGWCGVSKDLNILAAAMKHNNPEIQDSAISAMRDLGTPGATTFLGQALTQVSEALMPAITRALADMPEGDSLLEQIADDDDLLVRRAAADGLAELARKRQTWAYDLLVRLAREDPEWLVRSAAETLVEEVNVAYSTEQRVLAPPEIDSIDWLVAWAARQNLGLGVGDAALETLERAAEQGNSDVKILAAKTFAQIGKQVHQPLLTRLTQDADPLVARVATECVEVLEMRYRYPLEIEEPIIEPEELPEEVEDAEAPEGDDSGEGEFYEPEYDYTYDAGAYEDDTTADEQALDADVSDESEPAEYDTSGNVFIEK